MNWQLNLSYRLKQDRAKCPQNRSVRIIEDGIVRSLASSGPNEEDQLWQQSGEQLPLFQSSQIEN